MGSRQGPGISSEIEITICTARVYKIACVARGLASRLRLKSSTWLVRVAAMDVARGLASRLRLKYEYHLDSGAMVASRHGPGISSEIEILRALSGICG